jgi:Ca2+:H+ antiporter
MKPKKSKSGAPATLFRQEWFLGVGLATGLIFLCFGNVLMGSTSNPLSLAFILVWLFVVALGSVFGVVRHADQLAHHFGEPYGTLVLTLAVTIIEIVTIATMTLHGANNPTLVRDTLFAVVMIVLNGMVGSSLLVGGWRHREQQYNLQGANSYLGVIIPLAVVSLILPDYTVTTAGPTLSRVQEMFVAFMAVALYGTFLAIQTGRHRGHFTFVEEKEVSEKTAHDDSPAHSHSAVTHVVFLVVYMVTVAYLAEQLALPIDNLVEVMHAPAALAGLIIAILVATPEAVSAISAARANHVQRSVNISLGSVLATIGLTVPAMLVISHLTGRTMMLGVQNSDLVLLPLTLVITVVTFASGRTNILQGAVHLLLFAAYIVLIFQG